ncbi:hypothetical protein BDN71DRAFT_1428363 [Pleurotus eryngii]|uniref:Uncharacterized protein n=1 Tax=Pleurotus eryngii TaxID=5323 RepID=A0A9P6DI90_PLEER|nr:hypothetical protein BDN71DRAFT_1428363 [Pleurotus eryngii]
MCSSCDAWEKEIEIEKKTSCVTVTIVKRGTSWDHALTVSMPSRKCQQVLDLDHLRLSQSTWATTQFETDFVDGTEHEYTAYNYVPHQDSGIQFTTNAPTVVPNRTTPMVLDQEYTEDEQITVSAALKTKVQELQWHILCWAKCALKNGQANEIRQIMNLQEKISKGISDIALQSHVLGIEGCNIHNIDPPASMMGTEPLPSNALFSSLNDFEPPDHDIDVDNEESSDKVNVPTVLTVAVTFPPLAEHPTMASLSNTDTHMCAENIIIPLPSTVSQCAVQLRSHELALREHQTNALLKLLCEIIAEKSMLYSHTLCGAGQQLIKTRSRDQINMLNKKRSDLVFKELSKADIKSNTYVVNPNQPGSTTLNLSWIWHVGQDDESALAALQEMFNDHIIKLDNHWEELLLVKYKMKWTVRYFKHNHDIWVDWSSGSSPVATAYAQRKATQYLWQAQVAEGEFIKYN